MVKRWSKPLCLFLTSILLCLLLASCSTPHQEDPALTAIKEQWNDFVVNREKTVVAVKLSEAVHSSSFPLTAENTDAASFLDICTTLDIQTLSVDNIPEVNYLTCCLASLRTEDSANKIDLGIEPGGRVIFFVTIDEQEYQAYTDQWDIYESVHEFITLLSRR